jgi:hypothetical protein
MLNDPKRHQEEIIIRLESKEYEVDAEAVASMIRAITAIVTETQLELNENEKILVKARPFSKGSFEIPLDLVLVSAASLFDTPIFLQNILETIKSYISIRTELRGEQLPEPDKNGSVVLNGTNITLSHSVIQVFNSSRVSDAFHRAATDVAADPSISDINIIRSKSKDLLVRIASSELPYFQTTEPPISSEVQNRDRRIEAELVLRSAVFQGKGKWKFNLEGVAIAVTISDEAFLQRVNSGIERFASGDRLKVELLIRERFNHQLSDYERTGSYVVDRVIQHTSQPPSDSSRSDKKQLDLFDRDIDADISEEE